MAINGADNGIGNVAPALVDNIIQKIRGGNGQYSIRKFIDKINEYGYTITSRFECTFSLLPHLTFFLQDITTPEIHREFTTLWIDGREVFIPTIIEYGHEVTMTVMNDEKGSIYAGFVNCMRESTSLDGLVTIGIKTYGDGKQNPTGGGVLNKITSKLSKITATPGNDGMLIEIGAARIETVSGLHFTSTSSEIQTFDVTFKITNWSVSPANFMDAMTSSIASSAVGKLVDTGLGSFL